MPVSTRSKILSSPKAGRSPGKSNKEDDCHGDSSVATRTRLSPYPRNPHHNLKEKLKILTQIHAQIETNGHQQTHAPQVSKSTRPARRVTHDHPGHKLAANEENMPRCTKKNAENQTHIAVSKPPRVSVTNNRVKETEAKAVVLADEYTSSSNLCNSRLSFNLPEGFALPNPGAGIAERPSTVARSFSIVDGQREVKTVPMKGKQEIDLSAPVFEDGRVERIMVYVRVRPLSKKEIEAGARSCVRVVNNTDLYLTEFATETDYLRLKRLRGRHYAFDAVFPDSAEQEDVYMTSTAELIEGVLQGRNGSVFCYGATGAGKTHTMLGTVKNPGVMVLAIKDLFAKLRQRSRNGEHVVRLSYLEVYNESVKDLLSPGRPLVLREDKQGTVAAGLTHYQAYSAEEVMALLHQGNQSRTTEPTRVNETSSRSHAILQVVLEYKVNEGSSIVTRMGKLSLIDLAGSERALATDQRTVRSLEGANINRSLLALSSCINALVEGKRHIPYRNSKLTQLLKDSLGGACQTAMIANISPSNLSYSETQNTLHWADRAKQIRTKACVANEEFEVPESQIEQAKLLLEVQKENQQLRMQLARLQQKLLAVQSQALTSTPSLSCPSPVPPSPLTPSNIIQISDRHQPKNLQCHTIEPPPRHELLINGHGKTVEETIWELRRTIQGLQEESERVKEESLTKEKQLAKSLTALSLEHSVQLKHKDDFIRRLCQQTLPGNQVDLDIPGQEQMIQNNDYVVTSAAASTKPPSEIMQRGRSPKPRRSKTSSVPENVCNQVPRSNQLPKMGRRSQCSDLDQRRRSQNMSSPATGKKRTFWDITNVNSPAATQNRSTRIYTNDAPSMLLQPGFARYEPSLD